MGELVHKVLAVRHFKRYAILRHLPVFGKRMQKFNIVLQTIKQEIDK